MVVMEERNRDERRKTVAAHQPETSKTRNEMENQKTSKELIRISRDLSKVMCNIRQLEGDLAATMDDIVELNNRLRAANDSKKSIENEIMREKDEKERLTAALTNARVFCPEATRSTNLQLVDTHGAEKTQETVVFDDFDATCIGGLRTTDVVIKGVAVLESLVCVLYQSSVEGSCIRVFYDKTRKFQLNKVVKLPDCLEPDGLAANPEAQCLYVTDSRFDLFPIVWKVTAENDQVTEWTSYQMSLTLSVSLSGHVLILYNCYDDPKTYLDVCLSTAKVLRTYELPHDSLRSPLAVVETSQRNFIISYLDRSTFNRSTLMWSIYKMNADGEVICRFTPGDDPSQILHNPRYLFVDSWDRVIVADSGSNRLILLDSNLNWNGVLLERSSSVIDNFPRPCLYDNGTNQIFIAPSYDEVQQIDVYTLKLRPPNEMESKSDPSYQSSVLACAHVNQLPDVLLERILLKVCILKRSSLTTEDLFALATVDYNWCHKLQNKRLHKLIKRKLAAQARALHCRKHTIRINQKYLIESIQPTAKVAQLQENITPSRERDFVDRLHDAKCLSDKQLRFVRGRNQQRSRDVNIELLKIVRSFDVTQYATFVDCLRQTNQMTSADVLERGGVTVEMKLILTKESKRFAEEIVSSINRIRDKMLPQKKEFEEVIVQLMVHEIEILSAQKTNKDIIVIWLWCCSQESLFRLRELNMPNGYLPSQLYGITEKLVKTISQPTVLKMLHIEEKQLLQDAVVCPIPIEIRQIRNIRGKEFFGVAKCRDMIFILSQKPKLIQICCERPPYALLKSLGIKKIQNPREMTAGKNCLYIKELLVDKTNNKEVRRVSKIIFESEDFDQHRVLRWLPNVEEDFTLSACRDGRLLLMRAREPPTLEIYDSKAPDNNEACLVQTIHLDKDFSRLQHAVETQNGNFVVSHLLTNASKCCISEVNKSGQTVRRFRSRDDSQRLTSAFALALDSHGRVFVADYDGNQVILLDSQLKWIQVVLSSAKDGLTDPIALCYDEKMKQLVAAQEFTRKACSSFSTPVTMEPAIFVVDIPDLSKTLL